MRDGRRLTDQLDGNAYSGADERRADGVRVPLNNREWCERGGGEDAPGEARRGSSAVRMHRRRLPPARQSRRNAVGLTKPKPGAITGSARPGHLALKRQAETEPQQENRG